MQCTTFQNARNQTPGTPETPAGLAWNSGGVQVNSVPPGVEWSTLERVSRIRSAKHALKVSR